MQWPAVAVAQLVEQQLRRSPCDTVRITVDTVSSTSLYSRPAHAFGPLLCLPCTFAYGPNTQSKSLVHPPVAGWHLSSACCRGAPAVVVRTHRPFCVVWLQVLTFDAYGVSGHLNHCCVHEGVRWDCTPLLLLKVC
jgi:hypothetical protein